MSTTYKTYLRAAGLKTPRLERIRTVKAPGSVEIVYDRREKGGYRLHRYGEGEELLA